MLLARYVTKWCISPQFTFTARHLPDLGRDHRMTLSLCHIRVTCARNEFRSCHNENSEDINSDA